MRTSLRRYCEILSKYLKDQKLPFLLLVILLFSSIGFNLVIPQIMRYFIDAVQSGKPMENLVAAALSFLGAALLQQILSVSAAYMGSSVAWTATNALREDLASHCIDLDISFHKEKSPGEFIERIEQDATEFNQFFSQLVIRLAGNILLLVGILIALFLIDYRIGLAFTAFALAALLVLNRVRTISVPRQKALRESDTQLSEFLEERLAGTEDIRSCGAVEYVINKLYQLHAVILKRWRKASLTNLVIGTAGGLMTTGGYAMAMLLGYNLYQTGMISLGTAFVIFHYTTLLARPIRELTQQVENMQNIGASVERMDELLSTQKKILEPPDAAPIAGGPIQLDFEHVSFTYEGDEQPVINDLSFSISQGKILGLLGRTGGGKTTLARLIFRFYDPQSGSVRINGVDLREARIADLRKCVAYVTQDVQLFQASVRDNITFFDSGISDDKLMEAIEALGLRSWFDSLPDGLNTRLETGGRSLSAGEAQLLALTRIFLKDPGLIILDEASSRLDPATEQLMEHALDKVLQGRTAVIIAHRLATIHRADDILILEEGETAEYGNRLNLLSDPKSRFHSLYLTGLEESIA